MRMSDRLRLLRGERTQKEMAELLGVKPNNYNGWENGKEPNVETMIKIADFHGVTLDYLTGRVDYRNPEYKELNSDTGLSEDAFKGIVAIKNASTKQNNLIQTLNFILELELTELPGWTPLTKLLTAISTPSHKYVDMVSNLPEWKDAKRLKPSQLKLLDVIQYGEQYMFEQHALYALKEWRNTYFSPSPADLEALYSQE